MPRVVVISPYFNRADVVDRTVESIQRQTFQDLVAHFIDDGSTDRTHQALLKHEAGRIRVTSQVNVGFTQTMISAIAHTDSEFIAIQGSGDISHPERIKQQIEFLDNNRDVVAVGCHREVVSEITSKKYVLTPAIQQDLKAQLFSENPFSQGEIIMRRSIYEKAGGYRPYFLFRQDLDLWLRMTDFGRMEVVPQVLYKAFKLKESVSGDPYKLSVAMALRDFALHCATERMSGRPDPLDKIGPAAGLVRPRSATLANQLASEARLRAKVGLLADAEHFLTASINEKPVLSAWITKKLLTVPVLRSLPHTLHTLKKKWKPILTTRDGGAV